MSTQPSFDIPDLSRAADPYAPPRAEIATAGTGELASDEAEQIRNELLQHEASIRSLGRVHAFFGGLAFLFCAFALAMLIAGLFSTESQSLDQADLVEPLLMVALYGGFGLWSWKVGRGLRALDPKVRTSAAILDGIGIFGFGLFSLYALYLLLSKKGSRVLNHEYQEIVARTPHLRYRTSRLTWGILIVLGATLAILITVAVLDV